MIIHNGSDDENELDGMPTSTTNLFWTEYLRCIDQILTKENVAEEHEISY